MRWKDIRHKILLRVTPLVGSLVLKPLLASLRIEVTGEKNLDSVRNPDKGTIFAFWHSRILYMLVMKRGEWTVHTMVSMNKDGEYITRVAAKFGRPCVRGSTSRGGGKALLNMARLIEQGDSVAFTPDGPRGPREVFQPGAVQLARMTARPVVPVAYGVKHKKVFGSWDGFILPRPFTKGVFVIGKPIWPGDFPDGDEGVELMRVAAEEALKDVTRQADEMSAK